MTFHTFLFFRAIDSSRTQFSWLKPELRSMAELISDAAAVDSLRVPLGAVWRTRLDGDPA